MSRFSFKSASVDALLASSPSESASFLLELARQQASRRRPNQLMEQFARDAFVFPSVLDLRLSHQLDGLALRAAREFEALLLSPVAPLGCCSVLAPTSQDRTLSTTRGTEVVSDPTNMLALICAERLRKDPHAHPRLCSVHQVLRAQALPNKPGFSRHFRLFALAEAGRGRPDEAFEVDAIIRHISVFDRLFDLSAELGCDFPARSATIYRTPARSTLAQRVSKQLATSLAHIEVHQEGLESPYYAGLRVLFGAKDANGEHIPIVDVGVFDWVARLTSHRTMRFVASGAGIQLLPLLFRRP